MTARIAALIAACRHAACLALLLASLATAVPAAPTGGPAVTAPHAAATATNTVLETRDANGKLIGFNHNPEADQPVFAAQKARTPAKTGAGSTLLAAFNLLLRLAVVLAIAYVAMLLLKKYYYAPRPATVAAADGTPARSIRVLESTPLGPGRMLYLVAVGERCFLIGGSLQQLTLLGEVTGDAQVDAMRAQAPAASPVLPFQQMLSRLLPSQDADGGQGGRA